jgi:diguanylate cyclase (GGDEF)-like protein
MVLGPVLLGAIFVGTSVAKVGQDRASERLDLAANSLRTSVGALCGQLLSVAEVVAAAAEEHRLAVGGTFVAKGLANGIHVEQGGSGQTTEGAPPPPWADCAGPSSVEISDTVTGFEAFAASVTSPDGLLTVSAAITVDSTLVERLSGASGAEVTLLAGAGLAPVPSEQEIVGLRPVAQNEPAPALHSTLDDAGAVAALAVGLAEGSVGRTANGDLVRRIGPVPGQPLPLAVSLSAQPPRATYLVLIIVVFTTALAALAVAWWLARTATSPLAGLAAAADRVAAGELQTRVPARGNDEIARLANAFNHMTRELDIYVTALTASRDQLRGHLGVLGDTLSSTHDLDRILQVILQTARHATGASGGIVLLAESTGELVGKCAEGLSIDVSQVRVAIGQGLTGSVAATGVPRLGRVDIDGPNLVAGEPTCRTYVVVPFSAPSMADSTGVGPALPAARGVLALYDRLGRSSACDDFDDSDLVTLRTFAGQAAVAVDNVRVHEEAQRLSVTDSLTGLFNYRSLRETVRREAERAGRFGRKLAVLALDLDHFKEINDRYGHAAGDSVLAEFAQRIKYEIREVDFAFRQGGEEFVVLLPETDEVGGMAVADRLCAALRATPITLVEGITAAVTVSIGVAVLPDHGQSGAALLRAADEALYAAKTAGRDTFRVAGDASTAAGNMVGGASSSPQAPRQAQGR